MEQINFAIIVSGGSGKRLGSDIPKQYIEVNNKTILQYSLEAFIAHPQIHGVIVVAHKDYLLLTEEIAANIQSDKEIQIVKGGAERHLSVLEGLKAAEMAEPFSNVLIHDAVRPYVSQQIISDTIDALKNNEAVSTAIPVSDTIYIKDTNEISVPNRNTVFTAQTPQAFRLSVMLEAYLMLRMDNGFLPTDDVSVFLKAFPKRAIYIVNGSHDNRKITYSSDLKWFNEVVL
jgi:2-C-methyl-D-erythritol 4-phosphate cytidylyltransferase